MQSSNEAVITVNHVGKSYHMYNKSQDRLKQLFVSKLPFSRKKYYKEFWALKNISFEILRGETVGIIGRNGSGKSTLLQIIANTLSPTTGVVDVRGRVSALLELGSGFNPEFTGRDNIYLSGSILGIPRQEMDKRFDNIAAFADIGEFIEQPVKTYSSGMYARLAFAVAINVDPEILIVDEILSVGDAAFQAKCTRAFHRIRDKGCTVLLVTQDPYMVRTFCTTALYLRKGEMVAFGNPTDVTDKYLRELESAQIADRISDQELKEEKQRVQTDNKDATVEETFAGPLYRIEEIKMLDENRNEIKTVQTGQTVILQFRYKKLVKSRDNVVFVFSLYRHDDLYICGNTTLMDGHEPIQTDDEGRVEIRFPNFRLLSGNYKWRVAVDDERGLGIYTEAYTDVFNVNDELEAVGLFNMERSWNY